MLSNQSQIEMKSGCTIIESEFIALIRQLKTPHLFILRGDLRIPVELHLIELIDKELASRKPEAIINMEVCDRCLPNIVATAIGYIPCNDQRRIRVCERHFDVALDDCYYVLLNDQPPDSESYDFEKRILEKHIKIRGSRQMKYKPRHEQEEVAA